MAGDMTPTRVLQVYACDVFHIAMRVTEGGELTAVYLDPDGYELPLGTHRLEERRHDEFRHVIESVPTRVARRMLDLVEEAGTI